MKRLLFVGFVLTLVLIGPLFVSAAAYAPAVGGTGTTTPPRYGQLLVGNATKTYTLTATSSLGLPTFADLSALQPFSTTSVDYWKTQRNFHSTTSADYWLTTKSTTDLTEGINLYWTNNRFDTRLSGTTTLPNITTLANLGTVKTTLSGVLKATAGVLSTASAGTDYETPLTFNYPLSRVVNAVSLLFGTTTANTWSAHNIFSSLFATNASSTNATTTTLHITSLNCTGNANGGALTADANGRVSCSDDDSGAAAGAAPFNFATTFSTTTAATTTSMWTQGVFFSSSTKAASQFPYASTTALSVSGNSFLGTVTSGIWNGTSIGTAFTDAKVVSVAGAGGTVCSGTNPATCTSFPWPFGFLNTFGTSTVSTTTSISTQGVFFSSSTKAASQFPYASSTALTANDLFFPSDAAATQRNLTVAAQTAANTAGNDLGTFGSDGNGSGRGGDLLYFAGNGGDTGIGGDVNFAAGYGGATSGNGGDVIFQTGGTNSGINGKFMFFNPSAAAGILGFDGLTTDRTFAFPDQDGTICLVGVACDGAGGASFPFTPVPTHFGKATNATTTQIAFTDGLTASSTVTYGGNGTISFIASANGGIGIGGTTTPWGLLSIATTTPDYSKPLLTIATSSNAWGQLVMVSATSTDLGFTGSRVAIGTSTIPNFGDGMFWPLMVDGPINSSYAYLRCDTPVAATALTSDSNTSGNTCNDFAFDEDGNAASANAGIMNPQADGGFSIFAFAGLAANSASVAAAGEGAGIIPITSGAKYTASSSPIFDALVAASSTNATSTVFIVGNADSNIGTDFAPSDATIHSSIRYAFVATSGQSNWIATAKDTTAGAAIYVNTGIASTTAGPGLFFKRFTIFVSPKSNNSSVSQYFIDNQLVAVITTAASSGSRPGLNPRVSVGAVAAGHAKNFALRYIHAWWDLRP